MSALYNFDLLVVGSLSMLIVLALRRFFNLAERLPRWNQLLSWLWAPAFIGFAVAAALHYRSKLLDDVYLAFVFAVVVLTLLRLWGYRPARIVLLAVVPVLLYRLIKLGLDLGDLRLLSPYAGFFTVWGKFANLWLIGVMLVARSQKRNLAKEQLRREEEEQARQLIAAQNAELERLVAERTAALTRQAATLQQALEELQLTQNQLIQAEKMASLGELTAGIAHEIQNPLNFVNNFAEVSAELLEELAEEQLKPAPDPELELELLGDLTQNLQKITQHGQRASSIVRGMLEHSRASTGERTLTDLNALADEYLRLAYHGLRAKDKSFNATLQTDLAAGLPAVAVVPQDIGRVLLNLFTNAFYAVHRRQQQGEPGYMPTVSVRTVLRGDEVEVQVQDNGTGIPEAVQQKIFQPFFTTKPAGEGTGLGLSLAHDIVTKGHGGTLEVVSQPGQGATFTLCLPR